MFLGTPICKLLSSLLGMKLIIFSLFLLSFHFVNLILDSAFDFVVLGLEVFFEFAKGDIHLIGYHPQGICFCIFLVILLSRGSHQFFHFLYGCSLSIELILLLYNQTNRLLTIPSPGAAGMIKFFTRMLLAGPLILTIPHTIRAVEFVGLLWLGFLKYKKIAIRKEILN